VRQVSDLPKRGARRKAGPIRFLQKLGPGLITGAADDDPSGIGTYSIAGAQFGFVSLWTAWLSLPLMAATQLLCSRLGMITGRGLSSVIRKRYGRAIVWPACLFLAVANTVNIAADLGAMADCTAMITKIPAYCFTPVYAVLLFVVMARRSYRQIAGGLKWLTLVLFAYIVGAFFAHPDWRAVFRETLIPRIDWSASYMATLVALLGTTISPYLFFWQANQEVEEEVADGKTTVAQRRGATEQEKQNSRIDVLTGAVLSNLVMYFIILTAGATLHVHGVIHIATTQQAAEALRPLAGQATYLLFTLGIVGTGLLSVPVLAGSTAYAIADAAGWRDSLRYQPRQAPQFYGVLAGAFFVGLGLNFAGVHVIDMLFWSAVINGILAPPLIVLIVLMASDPAVMGRDTVSKALRIGGWCTAAIMTFAAVGLLATIGR
jgi:NRAMP (natural resistance-associated macrophage protein)-like metal ion transporter